ncbi:sugar phosphate nucleotidyltransferase [Sporofaciens musculi]|uniref:sugar phosphate nucleotidyltransferase n=1 Tax=Sporofaciens musculi TaxID=2681861 RepID=UPI00259CB289|nr:sugar phosphate nucleotidyltransferase [Sporofaciens musculi]
MDYMDLCVDKTQTVRDTMRQLDRVARKVLFVLEDGVLTGALTDGDVRRHLLNGGKLDDPVAAAANYRPITARNREQARKLLRRDSIFAVPVVRENGTIVDIILDPGFSRARLPSLNIPVVIMAGGKGTRLDPYTRVLPKPLIPVGERPIIEHIMQQFQKYACGDFHIVVNYKKQLLKAYFAESEHHYQVSWYDEDQPLGTGGGLCLLKGKMKETFFFTNCDILLCSDYANMLKFHRESGNAVTMIGAYKNLTLPYGVVETGTGGVIEQIREKPELSFLTNTGMYIVEPEVLEDVEDNVSIGFPDIMERQREKGRKVAVYPVSEDEWLDMGQITELEKMRERLYNEEEGT